MVGWSFVASSNDLLPRPTPTPLPLNTPPPTRVVCTSVRSKAMALVLPIIYVALWLIAAGLFSYYVLFVVLLCPVDPNCLAWLSPCWGRGNWFLCFSFPAGTWREYNVVSTSMQRHDVALTLRQRCINAMCPLGWFLSCVLSVLACLLFLLVTLVGCVCHCGSSYYFVPFPFLFSPCLLSYYCV